MEESLAYYIQSIIDDAKLSDSEKIEAVELGIGSYVNKIRKYPERDYIACYYKILGRPNSEGKFIIPNHPSIPNEQWGKEVNNREICWYEMREDQFLHKVTTHNS